MPFSQLKHVFSQMVEFTTDEWEYFISGLEIRKVKKGDFLLRESEMCNEGYFVNKGTIRNLILNRSGEEITTYFIFENNFLIEYSSYLQKAPSHFSIQALEDSEVIVFSRDSINGLYQNIREGNKLGRIIAEYQFILMTRKHNSVYRLSVEERYQELTLTFPDIHSRVPQYMIASYLGISRVHLSRIRAKRKPYRNYLVT